ncbi:unnamed protein product [Ilex paraguariensis]|uniref:Uncharacterized protein n=1 Tax=Ilex paraguariensis TaxID=185542 RepID=A0ABC8T6P8_9AQUA
MSFQSNSTEKPREQSFNFFDQIFNSKAFWIFHQTATEFENNRILIRSIETKQKQIKQKRGLSTIIEELEDPTRNLRSHSSIDVNFSGKRIEKPLQAMKYPKKI